ncbi:MAG TPA: MFS transporter [Solirubrobacteraceae bacterium]|nr:MFS transporter [Solirubrobacteraceae bacterium]
MRGHVRISGALFAGLGFQVGLWAVLVPELVTSRGLGPGGLGVVLGVLAGSSILALAAGGRVVDRLGRRPLAAGGAGGIGVALLLLGAVEARWALLPTAVLYGVANGCLDLGANAIGTDVERAHGARIMIRLHAGFSAAAALAALLTGAALAAGVGHATLYAAAGALLLALAAAAARAPLPPHGDGGPGPLSPLESSLQTSLFRPADAASGTEGLAPCPPVGADPRPRALLRLPGVATAVALVTLCFLGDGILEGYVALYLRDLLGAGALLTGAGLALFHGASLLGRLVSDRAQHRLGERNLITVAGVGAAAGMAIVVLADAPGLAATGLLLVGTSLAPVVPTALSVAGRADPRRSGAAVSLVTTVGYSAFVAGPPLAGALAAATSLRTALVPVLLTSVALALVSRRLP